MKHLLLSILTVTAGLTAVAQNYNMEITLSDGTKQYIPADKVSEVRFVTDSETPGQAFNILTEEYIPDGVLRNAIQEQVAKGSETLTNVEAAAYTGELILTDNRVQKFTGIEYLTSLSSLVAEGVFAKSLDVSKLTNLQLLDINRSEVESLDLGTPTKLLSLNIGGTKLTQFDLSPLPVCLAQLNVDNLKYESLDLGRFSNLIELSCTQNGLTSLNVAGLTKLNKIIFTTNNLKKVSFAGCSNLEIVAGTYNLELSEVDLTGCTKIKDFMFMYTALESFDAASFASTIEEINLGWTKVHSVNISNCTKLTYLALDNCGMTEEIDFSSCPKLNVLRVDGNEIPNIDLTMCPDIAEIQCSGNNSLKSFKLADRLTTLHQLNIDNVPALETFEWGATEKLQYANIYMTPLKRIDISKVNQDYRNLYLDYNDNLTEIKVWPDFDIENPPASVQKPANAKFVYEFTAD